MVRKVKSDVGCGGDGKEGGEGLWRGGKVVGLVELWRGGKVKGRVELWWRGKMEGGSLIGWSCVGLCWIGWSCVGLG